MAGNDKALILTKSLADRVDVNPSVSLRNLTAFTFEAWVKPNSSVSTQADQRAWCERQGGTQKRIRFAFTPIAGKLRFEFARADGVNDTNYTYPFTWDDYWHHCAFAADLGAETYTIFLDGAEVQTGKLLGCGKDSNNQALPVSNTASQGVYIGAGTVDGTTFSYWDGKIDCVRFWNNALSASTISANMLDFVDPTANYWLAEWRLEDTASSVITAQVPAGSTWSASATLKRGGVAITNLWTPDRPFLGGGEQDMAAPTAPTMSAPTDITDTSYTLHYSTATDNVYVQYYEVTVSETSDFSQPITGWSAKNVGLARDVKIDGLAPAMVTHARVRAVDANGNGSDYATYNSNAAITTLSTGDVTPPTPPTLTTIGGVTPDSFTVSFAGATDNVSLAGYKLDVALDDAFTTYVTAFRNTDIGLVSSYLVNAGLAPTTTYYVRARSYDGNANESFESNVLTVTTEALPDTEPPDIIVTQVSPSVEATRFTAAWNVGVDNVGVAGYRIDVSNDTAFTGLLADYNDRDVGNVLQVDVSPVEPQTTYYYRVRAYDAAGNVSANNTYAEPVTTLARSAAESGLVETATEPLATSYVSSAAPSTVMDEAFVFVRGQIGPYEAAVRALDNIRGYFRLNDPTTDAAQGLFTQVGTYQGTPTVGQASPLTYHADAAAVDFNGVDQYVSLPDLRLSGDLSLAVLCNIATISRENPLITIGNGDSVDGVYLHVTNLNKIVATVISNGTSASITSSTTVVAQTWYHVALTVSGTTATLYVNGTAQGTATVVAPRAVAYSQTYLGRDDQATPHSLDGMLAEALFTDDALTAGEVTSLYNAKSSAATTARTDRGVYRFDWTSLQGNLLSASLRLYTRQASTGTFTVQRLQSNTWTSDTITQSTLPAVDAASVSGSGLQQGYTEVDVTSLIPVGDRAFSVLLTAAAGSAFTFTRPTDAAGERPSLVLELDTGSAIEVKSSTLAALERVVTNYLANPSVETNLTNISAQITGATITRDTTTASAGTASVKVVTDGTAANQGVSFNSNTGLALAGSGRVFQASVALKGSALGDTLETCFIRISYTDATIDDSPYTTVTLSTDWARYTLPAFAANAAKTVDSVQLMVRHSALTPRTFWVDAAIVTDQSVLTAPTDIPYFDGDTTFAAWTGTAHASMSELPVVELQVTASYVGDGNQDASATVQYRRRDETVEIVHPNAVVSFNRSTKAITATVPAFVAGWNLARNPRFDDSDLSYLNPQGATVARVTDPYLTGYGAYALEITTSDANWDYVQFTDYVPCAAGDTFSAQMLVGGDAGFAGQLAVNFYTATGTALTPVTQAFTTTGELQTVTLLNAVAPASAAFAKLVAGTNGQAGVLTIPIVQLQRGAALFGGFGDGTDVDGFFQGQSFHAPSARLIGHQTTYDTQLLITDPDGIYGSSLIGDSVTTGQAPDLALTVNDLVLTAQSDRILVTVTYTGDDDATAGLTLDWKRHDLSVWSRTPYVWHRELKQAVATIPGLYQSTEYDVRATFTEGSNAVYGENPILRTVKTPVIALGPLSTARVSFGGFSLLDPSDPYVGVTEHDAFNHPDRETQIERLPRVDGGVQLSDYWATRKINMQGFIAGSDRTDLANRLAAMRKALAPGLQHLVIDTLDSRGYYFTATCTKLEFPEKGGETISHLLWNAEFSCADPFRYDSAETVEANIQMVDGDQITLSNDGEVRADPIFTITTTNAYTPISVTLTNTTTGNRITPDGTILRDDLLEINVAASQVTRNGVEIDFQGSFPKLDVGANVFAVRLTPATNADGSGTSTIYLTVRRRHRYF